MVPSRLRSAQPATPRRCTARSCSIVMAAAACLLHPLAANAGRPLATEDADVLEPRVCEWESFGARTRTTGAASARAWATQVGCGLGAGTQAALAYSRATEDGVTAQGLSLGGKTGLIARKDGAIGLTLAWGMGAVKAPAHSWRLETTYLNLVATRELADGVTGHANLGWTHDRASGQHSTTWNLAAEAALGRGVDVMAELYGDDRSKPWLGAGLRWTLSEAFSLNASAARQNDTPRSTLLTLGFKLVF